MSRQITLTLPDEVYQRASRLAQLTQRNVADLLSDTIRIALPPFSSPEDATPPIDALDDATVLALTELQMNAIADRRLSRLLDVQQAGELVDVERAELAALMQIYHEGLLRKAQALAEATRRGLLKPPTP